MSLPFKGRVSPIFLILSLIPLGIIHGGKNVETARSDLKMVQNCKISSFLGLEIRHSGFRRGLKSGALALGVVVIWHSGLGGGCNLAF